MNRAATFALTPLSAVYGVGIRLRNLFYRRGLLRTFAVDAPVISVGNLTTGGTGKTPLVQWIAEELATSGRRACVLTRGYARNSSGRVVVSDYTGVLSNVEEAGDEAFLLAQNLAGRVAVICDSDRVAAARWAIEHLQSDVFVLDDAFQYQRIKRQLNILTIDATNPWGNGTLLPAGNLREPVSELQRAGCIVITRADVAEDLDQLLAQIRQRVPHVPLFTSRVRTAAIDSLTTNSTCKSLTDSKAPVMAFCGVGNPTAFFALLRRDGWELTHTREFRDHHKYTQRDIDRIVQEALKRNANCILTTQKDAVKLSTLAFDIPCYVVDISVEIDNAAEFVSHITRALSINN